MFKTMKKFAVKYKKPIAIITILISAFLTYHFASEEEQATQEVDAIENIKDVIKEQVDSTIAQNSVVVDTPVVEEAPISESDSLLGEIERAQSE